jgi:hypothetical protein
MLATAPGAVRIHTDPFLSWTMTSPGSNKTKELGCFVLVMIPFPFGWRRDTSTITRLVFVTTPIYPSSCPARPFIIMHICPICGWTFPRTRVRVKNPKSCCHCRLTVFVMSAAYFGGGDGALECISCSLSSSSDIQDIPVLRRGTMINCETKKSERLPVSR